jgi:antitoxin component of MazEF toxin-antitoxin module
MKKITSLFLVFAMVLPVFIVPSVAYNEQTEVVIDVANNFDIAIEKKGNTRTAVVTDLAYL